MFTFEEILYSRRETVTFFSKNMIDIRKKNQYCSLFRSPSILFDRQTFGRGFFLFLCGKPHPKFHFHSIRHPHYLALDS